jgi:hypothetical protein
VASGTPVHSALLVHPWESCTVGLIEASVHSEKEFPAHSRKWTTETDGKRLRSSTVNRVGRSTRPWTSNRCSLGSMAGMPPKWIS